MDAATRLCSSSVKPRTALESNMWTMANSENMAAALAGMVDRGVCGSSGNDGWIEGVNETEIERA
jgi:hypothetical protein